LRTDATTSSYRLVFCYTPLALDVAVNFSKLYSRLDRGIQSAMETLPLKGGGGVEHSFNCTLAFVEHARSAQPCRYCFYSVVQKWVLRHAGATCCTNKCEIWQGEQTEGPLPKFHVYRGRNVGIHPQNSQNFEFWP